MYYNGVARHVAAEWVPFAKIVLVQIVHDVSQINTSRNIVSRTSPSASRLILLSLDIALCGAKRSGPAFSLFQAEDFLRFFFLLTENIMYMSAADECCQCTECLINLNLTELGTWNFQIYGGISKI